MSQHEPSARATLSRRSLLMAAGGGLSAAAIGATAACSSGGGSTSDDGPSIDPAKKVDLPEPISDVQYPDPYVGPKAYDRKPFADGSKTFKIVVPQDSVQTGDWNKNEFSAWLEKRTGVKVEYQAVNITAPDGSQDLSKINAMLSSGDLPDAFFHVGLSPAQISLYGEQGLFQDLTALIETYAPVEREMMEQVDTVKQGMTALDGKIYQFSSINDCFHCRTATSKAYINQNYLDKIGAKMPETTEDFRNVLKELKERNPSGKKGFLPFLGGNPSWDAMDVWFVNPFTYNPGNVTGRAWLRLNNGKVEFVPTTDGWRQGMAFMRQLFDDGTLTKQSFSITSDEMTKLGDQGLIGCARCFYWGAFISIEYKKDAMWHQYKPVMPLKGPSGKGITSNEYYIGSAGSMVITNQCKNPELLVQWADYQMDLGAIMRAYDTGGEKGKQWDWAKKGDKGIDGRQAVWVAIPQDSTDTVVGRGWNQLSMMYRSLDFRNGQYVDPKAPTFESDLYDVSKKYAEFNQPKEQELPPLIFDESDTAAIADLANTINNHVQTSMAKFATAGLDVNNDKVWNDYVAKFDQMNIKKYVELYQKAYEKLPK